MSDLISFEEFKEFWEREPIVIIDSCSLLDLYRYAPNAAEKIIGNLKKIQNNIWLPYHVFEEYSKNKETVISEAYKKFENVSTEVLGAIRTAENKMISKFNRYGKFKYPKINNFRDELEAITSQLKEKARSFREIVASEIRENNNVLREDEVNSFIESLQESNQIGNSLSLPEKIEIYREGKLRYSHLVPPGYKDIDKDKSDPTKTQKYGDLIIWKELLKKATENESPFIFVTDDEKEDWWDIKSYSHHSVKGELLGPRQELLSEFNALSKIGEDGFLMLTLPEFNKHISMVNEEVSLKEVYLNSLELAPEDVLKEILENKEWHMILDGSGDLTHSFIHDGELQEVTGEIITDVEMHDVRNPEFGELFVDHNEDEVIIDGRFSCVVIVDIETALSSEYRETIETELLLTGNITIEFNLDFDEEEDVIERCNEKVFVSRIEIESIKYVSYDDDYQSANCINCIVRPGVYSTYRNEPVCAECVGYFDKCLGCGELFEKGILAGSKCFRCDDIKE